MSPEEMRFGSLDRQLQPGHPSQQAHFGHAEVGAPGAPFDHNPQYQSPPLQYHTPPQEAFGRQPEYPGQLPEYGMPRQQYPVQSPETVSSHHNSYIGASPIEAPAQYQFGITSPPLPDVHELPNDQPIPAELPAAHSPAPHSYAQGHHGSARSSPALRPYSTANFSYSTPNLSFLDAPAPAAVPRERRVGGLGGDRRSKRQSMIPRLEMLPAPAMAGPSGRSASGNITFDQIIGHNNNGAAAATRVRTSALR